MPWTVAIAAALVGAVTDIRTGRIPNWLTLPAWGAGLAWGAWSGNAWDAAIGSLLLLAPYFLLFALAGGGAGDAKLMAAIGAWLGVHWGLMALMGVALAGVALGLATAARRKMLRHTLGSLGGLFTVAALHLLATRRPTGLSLRAVPSGAGKMPYGPAVFVGTCAAAVGARLWGF